MIGTRCPGPLICVSSFLTSLTSDARLTQAVGALSSCLRGLRNWNRWLAGLVNWRVSGSALCEGLCQLWQNGGLDR